MNAQNPSGLNLRVLASVMARRARLHAYGPHEASHATFCRIVGDDCPFTAFFDLIDAAGGPT